MLFEAEADASLAVPSGGAAVDAAQATSNLAGAEAPAPAITFREGTAAPADAEKYAAAGGQPLRYVGDRTFVWRDGVWVDTLYDADTMTPEEVTFLSDAYFALLDLDPQIGEFLALGEQVLFVWEGQAYEIVPE